MIAPGVHIYAATHPVCPKQRLEFELARPVTIGDNVWIGGHVTICPGVTVGDGVTIGAGGKITIKHQSKSLNLLQISKNS